MKKNEFLSISASLVEQLKNEETLANYSLPVGRTYTIEKIDEENLMAVGKGANTRYYPSVTLSGIPGVLPFSVISGMVMRNAKTILNEGTELQCADHLTGKLKDAIVSTGKLPRQFTILSREKKALSSERIFDNEVLHARYAKLAPELGVKSVDDLKKKEWVPLAYESKVSGKISYAYCYVIEPVQFD